MYQLYINMLLIMMCQIVSQKTILKSSFQPLGWFPSTRKWDYIRSFQRDQSWTKTYQSAQYGNSAFCIGLNFIFQNPRVHVQHFVIVFLCPTLSWWVSRLRNMQALRRRTSSRFRFRCAPVAAPQDHSFCWAWGDQEIQKDILKPPHTLKSISDKYL